MEVAEADVNPVPDVAAIPVVGAIAVVDAMPVGRKDDHLQMSTMKLPSGLTFSLSNEVFERVLPVILADNPHAFVASTGTGDKQSKSLCSPLICTSLVWEVIALVAALVGWCFYTKQM
jgi:hypothetical protein